MFVLIGVAIICSRCISMDTNNLLCIAGTQEEGRFQAQEDCHKEEDHHQKEGSSQEEDRHQEEGNHQEGFC